MGSTEAKAEAVRLAAQVLWHSPEIVTEGGTFRLDVRDEARTAVFTLLVYGLAGPANQASRG